MNFFGARRGGGDLISQNKFYVNFLLVKLNGAVLYISCMREQAGLKARAKSSYILNYCTQITALRDLFRSYRDFNRCCVKMKSIRKAYNVLS